MLGVLMIVYVFSFLDRQIVSILAERIKEDLGISDAQIRFLYGTAFAVFYAGSVPLKNRDLVHVILPFGR